MSKFLFSIFKRSDLSNVIKKYSYLYRILDISSTKVTVDNFYKSLNRFSFIYDYIYVGVDLNKIISEIKSELRYGNNRRVYNFELLSDVSFSINDLIKLSDLLKNDYLLSYFDGIDMKFPVFNDYNHIAYVFDNLKHALKKIFYIHSGIYYSPNENDICYVPFKFVINNISPEWNEDFYLNIFKNDIDIVKPLELYKNVYLLDYINISNRCVSIVLVVDYKNISNLFNSFFRTNIKIKNNCYLFKIYGNKNDISKYLKEEFKK